MTKTSTYANRPHPSLGNRYGKLVVVGHAYMNKHGGWMLHTECDCGKSKISSYNALQMGHATSCGCVARKRSAENIGRYIRAIGNRPIDENHFRVSIAKDIMARSKSSMKERGLPFSLSIEQVLRIMDSKCRYCGKSKIDNKSIGRHGRRAYKNKTYACVGIDRVDSTKGYTIDNVVPCCEKHNKMKTNMTQKEFVDSCKEVVKYYNA